VILGYDGKEVSDDMLRPAPRTCDGCGTDKKITTTGFGGHWRVNCALCGAVIDNGRGDPPAGSE
jgi:hypothetical protein